MVEEEPSSSFIRYHQYAPTTIDYDHELDAYTVARADIYAFDRRHHLTLTVVVTEAQMIVHRPGLEQAIRQGQAVLERLPVPHTAEAGPPGGPPIRASPLGGWRLR